MQQILAEIRERINERQKARNGNQGKAIKARQQGRRGNQQKATRKKRDIGCAPFASQHEGLQASNLRGLCRFIDKHILKSILQSAEDLAAGAGQCGEHYFGLLDKRQLQILTHLHDSRQLIRACCCNAEGCTNPADDATDLHWQRALTLCWQLSLVDPLRKGQGHLITPFYQQLPNMLMHQSFSLKRFTALANSPPLKSRSCIPPSPPLISQWTR